MVAKGILTSGLKGLFGRFGGRYCLHLRGESLVQTDAEVTVRTMQPKSTLWADICAFWLVDFPIYYPPESHPPGWWRNYFSRCRLYCTV